MNALRFEYEGGKIDRWIDRWLWAGIALVVLMMMIGAITRLTGSGLSIVEWRVVSGMVPPLNDADWETMFARYKQFPQYQKINSNFNIKDFKNIYWWEYIHRLLGRIIGLAFMVPFAFIVPRKHIAYWLKVRLVVILFTGMCQGIMGWLMVKSGLIDRPYVSHFRLVLHLGFALILISMILWTIYDVRYKHMLTTRWSAKLSRLPVFGMSLLAVQIAFGGAVAGLKAGYSFNTFPLMNGRFFPEAVWKGLSGLVNNGVMIQFVHRWFAFAVLACILWIWVNYRKCYGRETRIRRLSNLLLIAGIAQIIVGVLTLTFSVPVILGVLHQSVAVVTFCLLLSVIYLKGFRLA